MNSKSIIIEVETKKQFEMVDVTERVKEAVSKSGFTEGIVALFVPHTTAAIRINHNEPLLMQDIMKSLFHLVPLDVNYSHDLFELRSSPNLEARSNGHAHIKAFLLGSSETLIFENKSIVLGEKQSVFLVELDGGRKRKLHLKIIGE